MIYLIIPLAVWGLTIALLQYARGQHGFDMFFRHFAVISLAGLIGFALYKLDLNELGFPVFMGWVGLHSALLLLFALSLALAKRFRGRSEPSF